MAMGNKPSIRSRVTDVLQRDSRLIFIESLIALTIIWWVVSTVFDLTQAISSPELVIIESYEIIIDGEWIGHLIASLLRVVYALTLTIVVGSILGVALGISSFWEAALQDYITIGLALPSIFAAVFAAMFFGVSDITPMVAGAAIAFPFLAQNMYEGVKNVDSELIEMSSSFDLSRRRIVKNVLLRSILPEFFSGTRYAFAICWKIVVLSEFISTENGLGFMIRMQLNSVNLTGVIAWTLVFTVVILLVEYGIFQQIEKRVFAWRESSIGGF
jgi:ABC-type nitrate/sulfonate/bicarbonate transport system permease component